LGIKLAYHSVGRDKALTDFTWEITNHAEARVQKFIVRIAALDCCFFTCCDELGIEINMAGSSPDD